MAARQRAHFTELAHIDSQSGASSDAPDSATVEQLVARTGLSAAQVQRWFARRVVSQSVAPSAAAPAGSSGPAMRMNMQRTAVRARGGVSTNAKRRKLTRLAQDTPKQRRAGSAADAEDGIDEADPVRLCSVQIYSFCSKLTAVGCRRLKAWACGAADSARSANFPLRRCVRQPWYARAARPYTLAPIRRTRAPSKRHRRSMGLPCRASWLSAQTKTTCVRTVTHPRLDAR